MPKEITWKSEAGGCDKIPCDALVTFVGDEGSMTVWLSEENGVIRICSRIHDDGGLCRLQQLMDFSDK